MTYDPTKPFSSRFGGLGDRGSQTAHILKRVLMDGKVKLYEDESKKKEKVEILAKEGTVAINKEILLDGAAKIKNIEIFSLDNEPLGSIDVITQVQALSHTTHRFSYGGNMIGTGSGDVDMIIAQKVLDETTDPRFGLGASVDTEVIDTIIKLLQKKTI